MEAMIAEFTVTSAIVQSVLLLEVTHILVILLQDIGPGAISIPPLVQQD